MRREKLSPTLTISYTKNFFEKIYTETDDSLRPIDSLPISEGEVPTLTDDHKRMLELPFTPREFYLALKDLGNNKSLGSDGITKEFYLKFWDLLGEAYFNSISHSISTGSHSPEQRSGIITLIPKKGGDRLELGNWRPITLLNNDFKIYSKPPSKGFNRT